MSVIIASGKIQHGQIEVDEPINLPDGARVVVKIATRADQVDADWDNSPEGIADWLRWYDSLEPLVLTPEEEADSAAWLKKMSDYSAANTGNGIEELFR